MKKIYNKKKYNVFFFFLLIIIILLLTVGWSSFNSQMYFSSYAYVRVEDDVRVTNFLLNSTNNDGLGLYENFGIDTLYSNISLPNASSTVTYEVEVTNFQVSSGSAYGIFDIRGLPEGLKILSINDCGSGAQKTFYITIGYKNESSFDNTNTDYILNLEVDFREFHHITYDNIEGVYPTEIIDGGTLDITLNNISELELYIRGYEEYIEGIDYTFNESNYNLRFESIKENITIKKLPSYIIIYNANGGYFDNDENITTNTVRYIWRNNKNNILSGEVKTPVNSNYVLYDWYYDTSYNNAFNINSEITQNNTIYAKWEDKVAEMNGVFYDSLTDALKDVVANG